MATGDLQGSLRKIEQGLRLINYPKDVDYAMLVKGDPAAFLPIISYSFTSFSTYIAELLVKCDVELTAKSDLRFIEAIYKLLRDQFQYKPILTKQQFLQFGFAERKMQVVCDIIDSVVKKHKELSNSSKVKSQAKEKLRSFKCGVWSNYDKVRADRSDNTLNSKQSVFDVGTVYTNTYSEIHASQSTLRNLTTRVIGDNSNAFITVYGREPRPTVHMKPLVERHSGSEVSDDFHPLPLLTQGGNEEAYQDQGVVEVKCDQVTEDNSQIKFLKSQLADCQEKLHKLDWMEDKLHVLEEKLEGKVIIDEKDWNNLLTRVLLLETELLLQPLKKDVSTEFSNISQECTSSRIPVSPDTERKEDMPESLHQLSAYSSLLSTEPSPKAMTVNSCGLTDISKLKVHLKNGSFEGFSNFVAFKLQDTTRRRMERISKIIEETLELLKTSSNASDKT